MFDSFKMNISTTKRIIGEVNQVSSWYVFYILMNIVLIGIFPIIMIYIPKLIVDEITNGREMQHIILYVVLLAMVCFLNSNLTNYFEYKMRKIENEAQDNMKQNLGSLVMNMKFQYLEDSKILDQYETAYRSLLWWSGGLESISKSFINFVGNIISMMGIFTILFSERLSFTFFIPIFLVVLIYLEKKKCSYDIPFFNQMVKYNREFRYYTSIIKEFNFGKEIRLYNANKLITNHVDAYQDYSDDIFKERAKLRTKNAFWVSIIQGVFQAVMYLYLALKVIGRALTLGNFVLFSSAYSNLINKSSDLFWNFFSFTKNIRFFRQFFDFYDLYKEEDVDVENLICTCDVDGEVNCIEFCNVWFRYSEFQNWVLRDINIKISSNEKISIVGENGAGKTTFIKLLIGLYQPIRGVIKFNGTDIRNIPKDEYFKIMSTVFQDFKIYAASIKENIIMSEVFDEDRFWKSLKDVDMESYVKRLTDKYETSASKLFDADGIDLSGGQKQRLAIARAIYHKSPFIILDEPTSALDPKTEYQIYNQVQIMERDKGIIFISHRLSSCKFSDRVIVFQNGEIVQEGPHEELINQSNALYYKLFMAQAHYYN